MIEIGGTVNSSWRVGCLPAAGDFAGGSAHALSPALTASGCLPRANEYALLRNYHRWTSLTAADGIF